MSIRISKFTSATDNQPLGEDVDWNQLTDLLGSSTATVCNTRKCGRDEFARDGKVGHCKLKYTAAWSPAVYPPGATRSKANVGSVSLLVVDLDHLTDEKLAEIDKRLEPYQALAHSTHSDRMPHPDGDRSFRVVIALSEPVLAEDWPRFWATAMATLGLPADPACCDAGRLYFQPTHRSDVTPEFSKNPGKPLDVRAILAKAPPLDPVRELSDAGDLPPASPEVLAAAAAELERRGSAIEGQGGDRHTFSVCSALIHGWALTEAEAWPILECWNATCVPPWDPSELRTKLENASRYASGSYGAERLKWEAVDGMRRRLLAPAEARSIEPVEEFNLDDAIAAPAEAFDHAAGLEVLRNAMRGKTLEPGSFAESYHQALAQVRATLGTSTDDRGRELAPLFEHAHAIMTRKYDAPTWLVRSLVRHGGTLLVGGEPKTGKSWILTEIALACATGSRAFGEFETGRPIRVAYFFAEDLAPDVGAHLRALVAGRGAQPESVKGTALYVQPRGKFIDVLRDEDLAWLIASCRWHGGVDLLCIEPLRDIHSAEEDKSDGMAEVMRRLRMLGELLGATVAAAHHLTKSADGKRGGGKALRGSGAIHGSLDSGIYLAHRESTETSLVNAVDSEIKGARSAGKFDLALVLEDDAEGRSCRATWHVKRDGSSRIAGQVAADLAEASVDRVVTALSLLELRRQKTTTEPLRKESRLGTRPFGDALNAAVTMGLVERLGQRRGYKLTTQGQVRAQQLDAPTLTN